MLPRWPCRRTGPGLLQRSLTTEVAELTKLWTSRVRKIATDTREFIDDFEIIKPIERKHISENIEATADGPRRTEGREIVDQQSDAHAASDALNPCQRCDISGGAVEGMNNKLKVITRRAFGSRTVNATQVALYHSMGALPVPRTAPGLDLYLS
jgi:Transposase